MADPINELTELARIFVEGMGINLSISVTEQEDHYRIDLEGEDAWLLVEKKAAPLDALQLLVGKVAEKRFRLDKRIVVDCDGVRRARESDLQEMARAAAEKVIRLSTPIELEPMNPYERRLVHLALTDQEGVQTSSVGEGYLKRVQISRASDPTASDR